MSIHNTIPVLFSNEQDNGLLGNLFPEITNQNDFISQRNYTSPFVESTGPIADSLLKKKEEPSIFTNTSYLITVKTYRSGTEILKDYYSTTPEDKEIIFFCEESNPSKSNLFKTFILVKYGDAYKKLVVKLIAKTAPPLLSTTNNNNTAAVINNFDDEAQDNFNYITNKFKIETDLETIHFVMRNELTVTSSLNKTIADVFGWYNNGISYVVDGINEWLESLKFKDYQPPKSKDGKEFTIAKAIDALVPDSVEKLFDDIIQNALKKIKEFAKNNLPKSWVNFLQKAYNTIRGIFKTYQECVDFVIEGAKEAFYLCRAFLMGFINGLINTIQTILSLIGWLMKSNLDKKLTGEGYRDLNDKLEFIEDFIDLINENANNVFNAVINLKNDFSFEKLKDAFSFLSNIFKNTTIYDCAYMAGLFIFEVVIGVILAFFTGGASLVAEAANATEKAAALLRLFLKEMISTATFGLVEILKLFRVIITKFVLACKKGWKGLKQFFQNLFKSKTDEIIEEEGKVLDNIEKPIESLSESELDWMASKKIGNLGGKILTSSQIRKLRGLLKQKGIQLIVEDDIRNIKKLFKPIDSFEKADDLFYYMRSQDPPYVGLFQANTKQFFLKKGATEIIAFHEMAHLKQFESLGDEYFILNELQKEMYVWEQILANRGKWTLEELNDSLGYINRIRKNPKYGNLKPLEIK